MKNSKILSAILFFFLTFNQSAFAQSGEEILCKYDLMPTDRHVIIATSRERYNGCPLDAVNDYRTMTVKSIGTVAKITVCNNSPVPKGYKVTEWGRESQCVSLAINDQTVKVLEVIDADGDGYDYNHDCDDNNPDINKRAKENPYNGIDDNCNGLIDEMDEDGDGVYVYASCTLSDCPKQDCDDYNEFAGVQLTYEKPNNGIDDNCNGLVDEIDEDGDGVQVYKRCTRNTCPKQDCDDNNELIRAQQDWENPNNNIDDDCDGLVDEKDTDGDGVLTYKKCLFGNCPPKDCNDNKDFIYPGARERPNNGKDDDCDGLVDEKDEDGDKVLTYKVCNLAVCPEFDCDDTNAKVYPGAPEIVNNDIDENCSGRDKEVIWQRSDGGVDTWRKLNKRSPISWNINHLIVGDFDGDGADDIFRGNGHKWVFFSGGKEQVTLLDHNLPFKPKELAIGDFNGDGVDDILHTTGKLWRVAFGGKRPWKIIRETPVQLDRIHNW